MKNTRPRVAVKKRSQHTKAPRKEFHYKLFKNPPEVVLAMIIAATKKAHNSWFHTLLLGFLGGVWVGFSGTMSIGLAGGVDPYIHKLVPIFGKLAISLTFPIALVLILVAGGELVTGNVMIMSLGILSRQVTPLQVVKNIGCSYLGNFLGATVIAIAFVGTGVFNMEPWSSYILYLTHSKIYAPVEQLFLRAILCNFVVCAAVVVTYAAEDISGKIISVYTIIMIFVLSGWEHIVANMFYLQAGVFYQEILPLQTNYTSNYGDLIVRNIIPVTIGNALGPSLILAPLLWYNFYVPSPTKLPPIKGQKRDPLNHHKEEDLNNGRTKRKAVAESAKQKKVLVNNKDESRNADSDNESSSDNVSDDISESVDNGSKANVVVDTRELMEMGKSKTNINRRDSKDVPDE